jgi:hypothetical protein
MRADTSTAGAPEQAPTRQLRSTWIQACRRAGSVDGSTVLKRQEVKDGQMLLWEMPKRARRPSASLWSTLQRKGGRCLQGQRRRRWACAPTGVWPAYSDPACAVRECTTRRVPNPRATCCWPYEDRSDSWCVSAVGSRSSPACRGELGVRPVVGCDCWRGSSRPEAPASGGVKFTGPVAGCPPFSRQHPTDGHELLGPACA